MGQHARMHASIIEYISMLHSCFQKAPNVYDHTLVIHASKYLTKTEDAVPSGSLAFLH